MGNRIFGKQYTVTCFFYFSFILFEFFSGTIRAQIGWSKADDILAKLKNAEEAVNVDLPERYKFSYFIKVDSGDYKNKYISSTSTYLATGSSHTQLFDIDFGSPREIYDTIRCSDNSDTFRYCNNLLMGFQRHNMEFDLCQFGSYHINNTETSYAYTFSLDSFVVQEETRLNTVWYSLIRNDYYDCAKNLKKGDLSRFTPSRSENTIRKIKWIYDCDSLLIYRSDSNQTKSSDYWKTTTSIANSWYNYWKYKNIIFPNVIKKWGISTTDGQTLYPFVDTIMYNYKIQNDWVIGSFRQMDRVVPDCVAFHFPDFGGSYEINYLDHNIRIIYDSNKIINSIVFHWGDYSSSKQSSY